MRDGIALARRGVAAVALVTDDFSAQGRFVAKAAGMPDVPRVLLPHPVAGSGEAAMRRVAGEIRDLVLRALAGELRGEIGREAPAAATVEG